MQTGRIMDSYQYFLPYNVFKDLIGFISENYNKELPNSLLIAQAFIIKYPEYGKEYGLAAINKVIENSIKRGLF